MKGLLKKMVFNTFYTVTKIFSKSTLPSFVNWKKSSFAFMANDAKIAIFKETYLGRNSRGLWGGGKAEKKMSVGEEWI